jgi:hypothetical protein
MVTLGHKKKCGEKGPGGQAYASVWLSALSHASLFCICCFYLVL